MKIIIDNGHGAETPGKASPDGTIREFAYTRRMADALAGELNRNGIETHLLVTEQYDVPLSQRIERANNIAGNTILVSLHINAAGADNLWHSASGFSCFVAPNASHKSKKLARLLTEEAEQAGFLGNRCIPPGKFWMQNLAICRLTKMPAVLTESLFQDNRDDVATLLSQKGFATLITIHKNALIKFLRNE